MSNLGYLLNLLDEVDPPCYENDFAFGFGLHPYSLMPRSRHRNEPDSMRYYRYPLSGSSALSPFVGIGRRRQGERRNRQSDDSAEQLSSVGKDGFQVCMDVAEFKPNELSVKVVENSIVVEGKHEEREDEHGYIERHFVRRYVLPNGYDPEKVTSTLSSDGVLTVSVPKPQVEENAKERIVQIQQTGPAHLNIKMNTTKEPRRSGGGAGGNAGGGAAGGNVGNAGADNGADLD